MPGAALAGDQHRYILSRDAADGFVNLAHSGAGADDGAVDVRVGRSLGQLGRLAHPPGHIQCLADHPPQLVRIKRLEQIVVCALLHCRNGVVGALVRGDENHRYTRIDLADCSVNFEAALVGQAPVQEDDIWRRGAEEL